MLAAHRASGIGSHVDHWMGELNAVSPSFVVLHPTSPLVESTGASIMSHSVCVLCRTKGWIVPALGAVLAYALLLSLWVAWGTPSIAAMHARGLRICARNHPTRALN